MTCPTSLSSTALRNFQDETECSYFNPKYDLSLNLAKYCQGAAEPFLYTKLTLEEWRGASKFDSGAKLL